MNADKAMAIQVEGLAKRFGDVHAVVQPDLAELLGELKSSRETEL